MDKSTSPSVTDEWLPKYRKKFRIQLTKQIGYGKLDTA